MYSSSAFNLKSPRSSISGRQSFSSSSSTTSSRSPDRFSTPYKERNKNFKVVIRVRPPVDREIDGDTPFQNTVHISREQQIFVSDNIKEVLDEHGQLLPNTGPWTTHMFMFDHVYDDTATQKYVYDTTARNVVDSALQGYNATIFAYGQTGTGKTFTMEGFTSEGSVEARGIIPRAIEQIFGHIQKNASSTARYLVRASYLQIYGEQVSDLLKPERSNLMIREDKKRGVYVEGLSEWVVRSPAEIYGLMEKGGAERATGETKMNKVSSRSHAVFVVIAEQSETVYVDEKGNELSQENFQQLMHTKGVRSDKDMAKLDDNKKLIFKVGKLNLVDLAGSERVRLSGAIGQRFEESKQINSSLSALGNVISALTDAKGRQHIPYRDSKLTRMLEDSLGGNCKTTMMAMVSPSLDAMSETVSTLKFANRAKNIRNEARVNEDLDQKSLLRKYEKELKHLRAELESKNRDVVDKRRLLEIDDQRRRAEADKMAAIKALEARSLEFMQEKEEKRKLELRISQLMGQMIRGEGDPNSNHDESSQSNTENAKLRQEYEGKLANLEKERENIEEEKAQVDKYKQLLLKQRDIMIALTQRLVERDEQIMYLQEDLDTYDNEYKALEEKLDTKSTLLIKLQRISMEVNDATQYKKEELAAVLNECSTVMSNEEGNVSVSVESSGQEATEVDTLKSRTNSSNDDLSQHILQEENRNLSNRILQLEAQIAATPPVPAPLPPTPITQSKGNGTVSDVNKDTRNRDEFETLSRELTAKCNTLVQEKNAVQTIMEQKINILVQNVCKSVASVLQSNPASSTSPAGVSLARDVAALERLVSASVAALKASSQRGTSATNSAQYSAGSPMRAPPPPPSL